LHRQATHRETWHQVRHRYKQRWLGYPEEDEVEEPDYAKRETPGMRVQVVRSVSDWSHGVLTEHSIQNACKALPPATYPPSLRVFTKTASSSRRRSTLSTSRTSSCESFFPNRMGRALIDWMNLPSISSTYDNDEVKNQIAGALVKHIIRAAQAGEKIQVYKTYILPNAHG
jgi:phospholipase D1/2